jgi:hypothetical protein
MADGNNYDLFLPGDVGDAVKREAFMIAASHSIAPKPRAQWIASNGPKSLANRCTKANLEIGTFEARHQQIRAKPSKSLRQAYGMPVIALDKPVS